VKNSLYSSDNSSGKTDKRELQAGGIKISPAFLLRWMITSSGSKNSHLSHQTSSMYGLAASMKQLAQEGCLQVSIPVFNIKTTDKAHPEFL
jgi:hypothetical protein